MSSRPYVETVVFVGGISADVRAWVHEHPDAWNEVAWALEGGIEPGGRAANAALGAVRLGRKFVDLAGCAGDDLFGDSILKALKDGGVSVRLVDRVAGVATGVRQVVTDSKMERRTVNVANANGLVGESQIRKSENTIFGADLLCVTLEIPLNTANQVIRVAAKRKVPVLLDATPVPVASGEDIIESGVLRHTDVLLANWTSARKIVDIPEASGPAAVEVAQRLLRAGPKAVVVTMGEHGAVVAVQGMHALVPPVPTRTVDTTGAGDAFAAALTVGLTDRARGNWQWTHLLDATRFASAAASICVANAGGQQSMPTRAEVERALALLPANA